MTQPTLRITWLAGSFFERHGQRDRAIALYREYIDSAPGADILVPMLERAEQGGESPVAVADAADGMAEVLFNLSRSEEHTSELQSLMRISYAVFCLKKKQINKH